MILDLREFDGARNAGAGSANEIEVDLCIVGAGAAGITLAHEFINRSTSVCLAESGGFVADEETVALSAGEVVGRSYQPLEETHVRLFGGTTNIWHGACLPLEDLDFEIRNWVPHSGWPISPSELRGYYPRANQLCEIGSVEDGDSIWRDSRNERTEWEPQRLVSRLWRYSPPTRFGEKYREALESASNIRVLLWANGTNIHPDESNSRVEYIELRSLSGKLVRVRARAFVLAMGAIENAHLLLNSTDRQEEGLGNEYDVLGRYFMEHTYTQCAYFYPSDYDDAMRRFYVSRANGIVLGPGVGLSDSVQKESKTLACIIRFDPDKEPLRPGTKAARRIREALTRGEMPEDLGTDALRALMHLDDILLRSYGSAVHRNPRHFEEQGMAIYAQAEQAPNPESRVSLSEVRDALGLRRSRLDWRLSEIDRHTVGVSAKLIASELTRLRLGRVKISDWLDPDRDDWGDELAWGHHHAGTTRMAYSPKEGFTNADCRAHSHSNLYVAGGSVFPSCGYANPTLSIVAMTLRLADHLKSRVLDH
jgi:choline dehydrogenase-like flavoprotein